LEEGGYAVYVSDPDGVKNTLVATGASDATAIVFTYPKSQGSYVVTGGCSASVNPLSPQYEIRCYRTSPASRRVSINLGGDDVLVYGFPTRGADANGGAGNANLATGALADILTGAGGADTLNAGAGNDLLQGGASNDVLGGGSGDDGLSGGGANDVLAGGSGSDDIYGGSGTDTAGYGAATVGIVVTLDDVADDGAPGEEDNVHADVENVTGGHGDDRITGSAFANVFKGGDGNDALVGIEDADRLEGGPGNDTIDAGPGVDTILGSAGQDVIEARDGEGDTIFCGADPDIVRADPIDLVDTDCEVVDRTPLPPAPETAVAAVREGLAGVFRALATWRA
jgi:Ca2+-binding RTX toxin-like protein